MVIAGYFPGIITYFSLWYRKREQIMRIAMFCTATFASGAFGGILVIISISGLKDYYLSQMTADSKTSLDKLNYGRRGIYTFSIRYMFVNHIKSMSKLFLLLPSTIVVDTSFSVFFKLMQIQSHLSNYVIEIPTLGF